MRAITPPARTKTILKDVNIASIRLTSISIIYIAYEAIFIGFKFFCHQMLIGDPVDNYKPTKICGAKFGEKSSLKALEKAMTEQECLQIVIDHYKKWYPSVVEYTDWEGTLHKTDWKGLIDLYFKCVRMKSTKEDLLDFKEFASKYGVNLE